MAAGYSPQARNHPAGALPFAAGPAALLGQAPPGSAQLDHTCTSKRQIKLNIGSDGVSGFGHLDQVWQLTGAAPPVLPAAQLQRQLLPGAPRAAYRRRRREPKTVCHWGQRKLLLSEVEFLSECLEGAGGGHVVYAGAAPGTHMTMLSALFPQLHFTLVDPSPFSDGIAALPNVRVVNGFFDAKLAATLSCAPTDTTPPDKASSAERPVGSAPALGPTLFVSDVRTGDWGIMTPAEMESAVAADMRAQGEWVRALAPHAALLKFRLPWTAGKTPYLDGRVLLPLWGPATTTEARLLVTGQGCEGGAPLAKGGAGSAGVAFAERVWDNEAYMEQMAHFNTATRVSGYDHALVGGVRGLCACYDCASEVAIWCGYLERRGVQHVDAATRGMWDGAGGGSDVRCAACVAGAVAALVEAASRHCSPHGLRHLDTQPKHPAQRHSAWFKPKVFDTEAGEMRFVEGGGERRRGGGSAKGSSRSGQQTDGMGLEAKNDTVAILS